MVRNQFGTATHDFINGTALTFDPYPLTYGFMKTTIDLPDEILHRVKIIAAQRKTTLKELVLQGLSLVVLSAPVEHEKRRQDALNRLVIALKARNTRPMVPLKRDAIYDR